MPDAADQAQTPVAEAETPAAPAAPSEPTGGSSSFRYSFADAIGLPPDHEPAAVLNDAVAEPPKDPTPGTAEESPSEDGSKPADAPTPEPAQPAEPEKPSRRDLGREGNLARIAELEAELARVKSGDETLPPDAAALREQIRQEILTEQRAEADRAAQEAMSATQRAEIDRFEAACRMADSDPRLSETVPGTSLTLYQWREQRKETMALFPEAEAHFKAEAGRVISEARDADRATLERQHAAFEADLVKQIDATAALPHVDAKAWAQPGTTWEQMGRHLHAAGAAWKEAELAPQVAERDAKIAALEEQINDLRLVGPRGLGSGRSPVEGGRSAGAATNGTPTFDPDRGYRDNLADALGVGANGSR